MTDYYTKSNYSSDNPSFSPPGFTSPPLTSAFITLSFPQNPSSGPAQESIGPGDDSSPDPRALKKRKLNAAAAVRCRAKKQQQQADLKRKVEEAEERVKVMQNRVTQLEMENTLLRKMLEKETGSGGLEDAVVPTAEVCVESSGEGFRVGAGVGGGRGVVDDDYYGGRYWVYLCSPISRSEIEVRLVCGWFNVR